MEIIEFEVLNGYLKGKYRASGLMGVTEDELPFVEFNDIIIEKQVSNVWEVYSNEVTDWYGVKFTNEQIIDEVLSEVICECSENYKVTFLAEELLRMVKAYQSQEKVSAILPIIWMKEEQYELVLATDKFCYYQADDRFLMLRTATKGLVSDNYFAEVGLDDSLEAIMGGDEKLLYSQASPDEAEGGVK